MAHPAAAAILDARWIARGCVMDIAELSARAARRTGVTADVAGEVARELVAEIGRVVRDGGIVDLGEVGRLGPGAAFAPGPAAAAGTARERLADVSGYDEGVAPRDS